MDLSRYLVELRRESGTWDALPEPGPAARLRAEEMTAEGTPIRVIRSVYAPEDDAWFLVVEAPSAELAQRLVHPPAGTVVAVAPAVVGRGGA